MIIFIKQVYCFSVNENPLKIKFNCIIEMLH